MITEQNPVKHGPPWPINTMANIGDNYGPGPQIRVKCLHGPGIYYNFRRRREGDIFTLIPMYVAEIDQNTMRPIYENGKPKMKLVTAEEQFIPEKMERVPDEEEETLTTAQGAINKVQLELDGAKAPARRR